MLDLDQIDFSYDEKNRVLNDLTFSVKAGEITGYLGINGSGKTTTFLLCTGFLKPDKGRITILGESPERSSTWKGQVGVVSSRPGHYGRLSVRRNLSFFAELYGIKVDLDAHLQRHGLTDYADRPAGQLSQGFRQRLTLARATIHQPKLLLLDEPADGLDPGATEELYQHLKTFRKDGGGVLLTSHRVEEVERLCDRVVLLESGTVRSQGTPKELAGDGTLRERLMQP